MILSSITMKNIYHNKCCLSGAIQIHIDPPPIPLIKCEIDTKSEKNTSKLNCAGMPYYMHFICIDLRWPYFIMDNRNSFLYLIGDFILFLMHQEILQRVKTFIYIRFMC